MIPRQSLWNYFYLRRLSFSLLLKSIKANICEVILIAQANYDKAHSSAILCWKGDNQSCQIPHQIIILPQHICTSPCYLFLCYV